MLVTWGESASLCVYSRAARSNSKTTTTTTTTFGHTFRQLHPLRLHSLTRGSMSKNEHAHLSGNESGSYLLLLLSPLSGGSRRPALGYSHYLGDVGLGSGLFSHWQHSLHCHHGKRLQWDALISHSSKSLWYHTHTQAQFKQVIFVHEVVPRLYRSKEVQATGYWSDNITSHSLFVQSV